MDFAHCQSPKWLSTSPPITNRHVVSLGNTSDSYLESLAQEAKKNDMAFMDIIKEFSVIYNRACADYKDRKIKNNARRKISELLDLEESKRSQRYERSNSLSDRRNSENSVWN